MTIVMSEGQFATMSNELGSLLLLLHVTNQENGKRDRTAGHANIEQEQELNWESDQPDDADLILFSFDTFWRDVRKAIVLLQRYCHLYSPYE